MEEGKIQKSEREDAIIKNGLDAFWQRVKCSGNDKWAFLQLRSLNLSQIEECSLSQEEFERFSFDSDTVFSDYLKKKYHIEQLIETGKSFGLRN